MEIIDVLNLKLGDVQDNSLLVCQIVHSVKDMQEVQVMCEHLKRVADKYKNIEILVIGKDMKLELCPESHMNKLGWYRKNEDGTAKIAQ